jgi:ParB-like chromosome segregation protein Spo0J
MIKLKSHPLSEMFPVLTGDGFDALVADIKDHGLQSPIELYDDQIIDGRNRYAACLKLKIVPETINVKTDDPMAYVLSRNLHRRHLTVGQRALIAAKAKEYYASQSTLNKKVAGKSRDKAGAAVGISGKSVDAGAAVLKDGVPELVKAVESGEIAISAASAIAGLPAAEQRTTICEYTSKKALGSGRDAKKDKKAATGTLRKPKASKASRTLTALKVLWLRADNTERADFLLWTKDHTE